MLKHAYRLAALAALVPIALALSAAPSQAQVATGAVTVSGTATCNIDTGHPTWTLHWTIENSLNIEPPAGAPLGQPVLQIPANPVAVQIDSATETGLVTADITSAVTPNPIPGDGSATATDGPVPNAVGDVDLSVSWSTDGDEGVSGARVHLDGSCVLPDVSTVAPTTAPPAVKTAVAAAPAFTG